MGEPLTFGARPLEQRAPVNHVSPHPCVSVALHNAFGLGQVTRSGGRKGTQIGHPKWGK